MIWVLVIVAGVAVWALTSVGLTVLLGRMIDKRDEQVPR
jgi:hypothetical protein